jgi:hypothetical protein
MDVSEETWCFFNSNMVFRQKTTMGVDPKNIGASYFWQLKHTLRKKLLLSFRHGCTLRIQ